MNMLRYSMVITWRSNHISKSTHLTIDWHTRTDRNIAWRIDVESIIPGLVNSTNFLKNIKWFIWHLFKLCWLILTWILWLKRILKKRDKHTNLWMLKVLTSIVHKSFVWRPEVNTRKYWVSFIVRILVGYIYWYKNIGTSTCFTLNSISCTFSTNYQIILQKDCVHVCKILRYRRFQ